MAMMDYGAIAFKNGKLVSTDVFTPMIDMVGWEDTEEDIYHDYYNNTDKPLGLKGNYFAYIGDEECTVAFYKNYIDSLFGYKTKTQLLEIIRSKFDINSEINTDNDDVIIKFNTLDIVKYFKLDPLAIKEIRNQNEAFNLFDFYCIIIIGEEYEKD